MKIGNGREIERVLKEWREGERMQWREREGYGRKCLFRMKGYLDPVVVVVAFIFQIQLCPEMEYIPLS